MSSNEPSQTSGNIKSIGGQVEEAIGNVTGSTDWQASGKARHAEGEGEIKAAQAKGYAEGLTDQATGYGKSVLGALTGDKTQQVEGNAQNEAGAAKKAANAPA